MEEATLSAPNVMVIGQAGTGKTRTLGTLVDAGINLRYLDLENGLEALLKYWGDQGKPVPKNLAWHKIAPPKRSWAEGAKAARRIIQTAPKVLMETDDPDRAKYDLFVKIWETMANFHDDRTGKDLGAVDEWPTDCAIAFDGLTGMGHASMSSIIGGKILRSQQNWGMAMDQLEGFLRMMCDQVPCWFILLAHIEKEPDEIAGGNKIMASTLGKKLAPKLAPMFSDVILAQREAKVWTWDTINSQADLKARNLPWAAGQKPDFKPIVEQWRKNAAAYSATMAEMKADIERQKTGQA